MRSLVERTLLAFLINKGNPFRRSTMYLLSRQARVRSLVCGLLTKNEVWPI